MESNLAGYDILSVVDKSNSKKLKIEVKASTSNLEYAKIHITKNEWLTAQNSINYIFHLWHIDETSKLYIIDANIVNKNIPNNKGDGEWETVEIPFKALINSL